MPIPISQLGDSCASNPCWGESICITLSNDVEGFKCICFGNSQGKYCQNQIKKNDELFKPMEAVAIEEVTSDTSTTTTSLMTTTVTTKTTTLTEPTTTTADLRTFIPINDFEPCNHNTCQLGRCLENGTCQCIEPAIGKYCEKINECIFLKCVYVCLSVFFVLF